MNPDRFFSVVTLVKQLISPQPHPSQASAGPPAHHQYLMPNFLQHRVSSAGFGLRPAVRWTPPRAAGCLLWGVPKWLLSAGRQERGGQGALDTLASHLALLPSTTPGEYPGPGSSSRHWMDVFRPARGTARGPGFFWTDKSKGRRGGRGRGGAGERKKTAPRMSDVTDGVRRAMRALLAAFLGRRSCGKSPARRGSQTSVPVLPAACPGTRLLTGTWGGRNCTTSPGGSRRASRCEPPSSRRTAPRRRTAGSGRRWVTPPPAAAQSCPVLSRTVPCRLA